MTADVFRPCAVIPVYNHGKTVGKVAQALVAGGLPVILVDDGSNQETKADLAAVAKTIAGTTLHTLPQNTGKGGAVTAGLLRAHELGYSHALQVDADGQHDLAAIEIFLAESRANTGCLIAGRPVYDETVPLGRKIGRKITNFWVAMETLSRDIPDAMCGFRVYPVASCYALLSKKKISTRMEFDIEILVRLHWRGVRMVFMPVRVVYPEGGISHFHMFRDNVKITGIHTLLFFGMIVRMPLLLYRRLFGWVV